MTAGSRHIGIVIARPAREVYAFASQPQNLPRWAGGLAGAQVDWDGQAWATDSPMGRVRFEFAPDNDLGVLDHTVTLPSGDAVYNPLRVLPYGDAAEVVFSLRPAPGMSEEGLEQDAAMVASDLQRLKALLEA